MKTTKRLLAVLLALVLLCVGVPFAAQAEDGLAPTGSCGENVTWTFDAETGALTIIGEGAMTDYSYESSSPFLRSSIKSLIVSSGVTSIGDMAFVDCESLTSVEISDSVTSIGGNAFSYCTALPCMEIPDSVAYIGDYAFYSCRSLTNIYVSENNPIYASDSFGCLYNKSKTTLIQYPVGNSRTWFTIPDSVTSISYASFRDCISLTSVTIPDSVTSICGEAFNYCLNLTSVMIPDSVKSIGIGAFFGCHALASITLGNGVTSIGNAAFYQCYSLRSVTIPDSVTSIGEEAFCDCISLTRFYISETNSAYATDDSGCLYNKNKTSIIQYPSGNTRTRFYTPDSVTSIGRSAFWSSDTLTSVTISENVTSIGEWAFYGCLSLQNVMIPDSVTSIGDWAFNSCRSLTDIYYSGSEEEWEAITIGSENYPIKTATIHFNYHHEHEQGVPVHENVIPATCSQAGSYTEVIYCVDCAKELSRETIHAGDPLGHDYGDWYKTAVPSCTEAGTERRDCSRCDVFETREIDPLGHDPKPVYTWADDDTTVTATMVCTRCDKTGATETAEVKTEVTVKPTCSTEGELTLIAAFNNKSFYGQTKTKTLPRDPNAHVFKVTVTPPTCLDDGYTTHACTLCRYGYSDEIVPALGHDYQHYDAKAPTCEAPGWDAYDTCSRCDYTTYSELATVDHDDADNDGKCDMCGEQMRGGSHCKYCGKIHGGAFGWLTKLLHSILAIFKR